MKKQAEFDDTRRVIDDPIFIRIVGELIDSTCEARGKRTRPKEGLHYRRDWFDTILDIGGMNKDFFLSHINDIWLKKSTLNSEIRGVILEVCNHAVVRTMQEYHSQSEKKADMKIIK